jgi:hypothetical protein
VLNDIVAFDVHVAVVDHAGHEIQWVGYPVNALEIEKHAQFLGAG